MMRAKLTMPSEQPIVVMTSKRKGLDTVSKALMVSRKREQPGWLVAWRR
jgi:hypothetical protein